jgi:hypothetical protein
LFFTLWRLTVANKSKPTPPDEPLTREDLGGVATGLGIMVALATGAVEVAPSGLKFSDSPAGAKLKAALVPQRAGLLIGDALI